MASAEVSEMAVGYYTNPSLETSQQMGWKPAPLWGDFTHFLLHDFLAIRY